MKKKIMQKHMFFLRNVYAGVCCLRILALLVSLNDSMRLVGIKAQKIYNAQRTQHTTSIYETYVAFNVNAPRFAFKRFLSISNTNNNNL